jgi:(E)-4-hydroxy-3-methylbut-2-enyl-diphosphate synthase
VHQIQERTKHIKAPLNVSVMGCVVNALGEAKEADVAIAYGKGDGMIIKKGEIIAKLPQEQLVERFIQEIQKEADKLK